MREDVKKRGRGYSFKWLRVFSFHLLYFFCSCLKHKKISAIHITSNRKEIATTHIPRDNVTFMRSRNVLNA